MTTEPTPAHETGDADDNAAESTPASASSDTTNEHEADSSDKSGKRTKRTPGGIDPSDRQQLVALGARLRQLRQARGYKSQLAFVLEARLPRSYYGDIERGQTNPTMYTLLVIAKALGVRLADLFVASGELPSALDTQDYSTALSVATKPSTQGQPEVSAVASEAIEPFPFDQAQRLYRSKHPALGVETLAGRGPRLVHSRGRRGKGGRRGAGKPELPWKDLPRSQRKFLRERERRGTLVGTAIAARMFGVDPRTIERWVEAGKLLPWDWVDNRLVVFKSEEIEALAREYREYLELKSELDAARSIADSRAKADRVMVASNALKRLLMRYKRERRPRGGRPAAGLPRQPSDAPPADETAGDGSAC